MNLCPAGGYLVMFRDGTNAVAATQQLESKYGFKAKAVWQHAVLGFAADLSLQTVAQLRCEPEVSSVWKDSYLFLAGDWSPCEQ